MRRAVIAGLAAAIAVMAAAAGAGAQAAPGFTVTPWGVLNAGVLTGRAPETLRWPEDGISERAAKVVAALHDVAEEAACTPAQAAIAWLLDRHGPPLVPIVGVRNVDQLRDNLGALHVELTDEQRAKLDAAALPALGFPRSFLESDGVRDLIYGETWTQLVLADVSRR